ncbi:MAG: SDR family NAD(P)-dependent oxidoreductase [Bermanella sp.]
MPNNKPTMIITGAASGIGKAVAEMLLKEGWYIGLFDLAKEPLEEIQKTFGQENCSVHAVSVTDENALALAFKTFMAKAEKLDVLFNCAGLLQAGHFEDISLARHNQILAVNNQGVMNCCFIALPYLKQNKKARVINMSSASSLYGVPGLATYSASKAWIKSFTESLNIEWARHDIHVLAIEPPFVNTNMIAADNTRVMEKMGVDLTAEDVANSVKKSLKSSNTHIRVSFKYKIQVLLSAITVSPIQKLAMRYFTGY